MDIRTDQTVETICEYLVTQSRGRLQRREIDENADLLDAGYVDSIGVAELLARLEDRFGVAIPEKEIVGALSNIKALAGHIDERTPR